MTGHTGNGIVQNNHGGIGHVVGNIGNTGYSGMNKGRITNDTNAVFLTFRAHCFVKAMQTGAGSSHTDI